MTRFYAFLAGVLICLSFCISTCTVTANASYNEAYGSLDEIHDAAERLRSEGYCDDDDCIKDLQVAWWGKYAEEAYAKEIKYIAKTVWGEARGLDKKQQAAVVWCILNRVDAKVGGKTIIGVVTAKNQFGGYLKSNPVTSEIKELVIDVMGRWLYEKAYGTSHGRVLPNDYFWFSGIKRVNYFRNEYHSKVYWDWSLPDPYELK